MNQTAPLNYLVVDNNSFLKIVSKAGSAMIRKVDIQSVSMVGDYLKFKLRAPQQSLYLNRMDIITPLGCTPIDNVMPMLQPPGPAPEE